MNSSSTYISLFPSRAQWMAAILLLALFTANPGYLRAQFQNDLQPALTDYGYSGVEISPTVGYMVLQRLNYTSANYDVLMSKLLPSGAYTPPSYRIGSSKREYPECLQKTFSLNPAGALVHDGYIVVGETTYNGDYDLFLFRINLSGAIVWSYRYGLASSDEYGFCVQQTSDLGFVACGYTVTNGGVKHPYVLRTTSAGIPMWNYSYPFSNESVAYYLTTTNPTSGPGLYVTGYIKNAAGNKDVLLMSLNMASGLINWSYGYAYSTTTNINEEGRCVKAVNNGAKLVVTGNYATTSVYTMKTDLNGTPVWGYRYFVSGKKMQSYRIEPADNAANSLVIGGDFIDGTDNRVFYQKINTNGAVLACNKYYWSSQVVSLNDMRRTSDGGYFGVGNFHTTTNPVYDTYVLKSDAALLTSSGCPAATQAVSKGAGIVQTQFNPPINQFSYFDFPLTVNSYEFPQNLCTGPPFTDNPEGLNAAPEDPSNADFRIYPNPAFSGQSELTLETSLVNAVEPFTVMISDIAGRQIAEFQFADNFSGRQNLQVGDLPAGTFLISVIQNHTIVKTTKYIRMR